MGRPQNILLIQSDNHTRGFLGCYGHPVVRTPNLDGLARRGARFTRAYSASALCCPSRAAMASGRFPHQTGYYDNVLAYDGRVPSWMHRLRDAGHEVVAIGKLHYRSSEDDNGFSSEIEPMHIVDGRGQLSALLRWCGKEPPMMAQRSVYLDEVGEGGSDYQDYDSRITAHATKWLSQHALERDQPWALVVSYTSPHPPFRVAQRFVDMYDAASMPLPVQFRDGERPLHPALEALRASKNYTDMWDETALRRVAAGYCGLISFMDEQVGLVLQAAADSGALDNTLVVYTSDHGELYGTHGLFGKSCLYEEAVGVPLIVSGPGVGQDVEIAEIASHVDLFPTLVEAAGIAAPEADHDLPGASLWPAIRGEERDRRAFAEYHGTGSKAGSFMLRTGDHKIVYHVGMPAQVFDLREDPHETDDLARDDRGQRLARELEALLRQTCDPEEVDRAAKEAQRRKADSFGGTEVILQRGVFKRSPPPGVAADYDRKVTN